MIRGNETTKIVGIGGEEVEELKLEALHHKAVGEKIRDPHMRLSSKRGGK